MIPAHVPQRHYGPLQWGPGLDPNQPSHKEYLRQFADDFTEDLLESLSTVNPKPHTLNPKPQTLNPKP